MKKLIILFMLLFITVMILPPRLFAGKYKHIERLTVAECNDVDCYMATIPDPNIIRSVERSKSFHHTNTRRYPQMRHLNTWVGRVNSGLIKCKKRVNGEYKEVIATQEDIDAILFLDRPWHTDPNYLEDILNKERCPLDGHLYDAGDPNEA